MFLLKIKKAISIVNAFQKILVKLECKPNKIWGDKGSKFYNNSFKKWLKDNDIDMHSIHNQGKSVVAEIFIRTLKNNIYKYMTEISKIVYTDKLGNIKEKEVHDKDPKFKVGDFVRISKYKYIFAKEYMPNWSEEVFISSKLKNTVPWTHVINDLNGEKNIVSFMKKNCKRLIKKNLE